jgi:hypothetical protein
MVCLNFSLLPMMCASIPWTAASIQGLCASPTFCPVTMQLKKSSLCSLYRVRKVNALACHFILCPSVSIFGTQHEHDFRKRSLSDTISWRSDWEICEKCRKSDEMLSRLYSWIFSSTASTKSLLTRDSRCSADHYEHFRVLRWGVSPISLSLNHSWNVLHTPHKVDDECQPVSCFLQSRNGPQTAFHKRPASWFSW